MMLCCWVYEQEVPEEFFWDLLPLEEDGITLHRNTGKQPLMQRHSIESQKTQILWNTNMRTWNFISQWPSLQQAKIMMSSLCYDGWLGHEVRFMGTLIKLRALFEHSHEDEFPLETQSFCACLSCRVAVTRVCKSVVSQSHKICTQNSILITAINNSTSIPAVAKSACGRYYLYIVITLSMEYYDPYSHIN
jgi:hypothetical protein